MAKLNNRPVFLPKHEVIRTINFCITSRCTRRCPYCSYGIGGINGNGSDLSLEDIKAAIKLLGAVDRYNIAGGEAPLHPQFDQIVAMLPEFPARERVLECNGDSFKKWPLELFNAFDFIYTTRYGPDYSVPNSPSNAAALQAMHAHLSKTKEAHKLVQYQAVHFPHKKGDGKICPHGRAGTISYWNKKVYPCCTAHGQPGAIGIPLTANWRKEIMQVPLPCAHCVFAV